MLPDLNRVIEQVSKEKGIDRDIIVKVLEEAMLSAAKKTFGQEKNIEAKFKPDVGEMELFEIKTVVNHVEDPENQVTLTAAREKLDSEAEIGDELLVKLPAEKFSRIAAQAAKQDVGETAEGKETDEIGGPIAQTMVEVDDHRRDRQVGSHVGEARPAKGHGVGRITDDRRKIGEALHLEVIGGHEDHKRHQWQDSREPAANRHQSPGELPVQRKGPPQRRACASARERTTIDASPQGLTFSPRRTGATSPELL